jgi:uncharacterized membrane protein
MKRQTDWFFEKYTGSPALASLAVAFVLAFLFQIMRQFAGHNDGSTVKAIKIITALIFFCWAISYIKKYRSV